MGGGCLGRTGKCVGPDEVREVKQNESKKGMGWEFSQEPVTVSLDQI